jgi:hypothetical protein
MSNMQTVKYYLQLFDSARISSNDSLTLIGC